MSEPNNPCPEPAGYRILGVIAHGDTGVVYRAMDTTLGWEVAVKALHDRFAPASEAARQFIDAARIMGQIQHPGIPPVHAMSAFSDGRPFFVMPLIRGRTLHDVFEEGFDPVAERGRLLKLFHRVCLTVAYAHFSGVAHRNLKPEHIMIGAFGEVQVVGWGAAVVFGRSVLERSDAVRLDCRFDVFSLGGILCKITTGRSTATDRPDWPGSSRG